MITTLNKCAKNKRLHVGLQKMFWVDASNTVAFMINQESSILLDRGIPKKIGEVRGKLIILKKKIVVFQNVHNDLIANKIRC